MLLFSTLAGSPALAQETQLAQPTELPAQTELDDTFVAPVVIDGETLFLVRGSSALPARERAEMIQNRIFELAELPLRTRINYTITTNEFGRVIHANGKLITVTTLADAEYDQFDIDLLAGLHSEAIQEAVKNYREDRSSDARVNSAYAAIAWTVGFLVVSVGFFRLRARLVSSSERLAMKIFERLGDVTKSVVKGKAIAHLVGFFVKVGLWFAYFFLLYYYLSFVLLSFAETRPFAQVLLTYISEPMVGVFFGFLSYIPNLITITIITIVVLYILRGVRLIMENVESGVFEWKNFEPHWIKPTYNIVRFVVIAIALVFAYPYIPGADSRAFQGLTILAGIMLSLGSNTVVSNIMAGLFVLYRRSTNVGDRIKVGEQVGDVVEIKLMETLIKSIKNELISIPNATLLNSEVVNYSHKVDGRGLLVHTSVGIGYEEPKDKVVAMLIQAALKTPGLKKTPDPFVLCTGLADYSVTYQINAFTTRGSKLPKILSDLHYNILDVFNENGVQIMTPSYMADPDIPKIPDGNWDGTLIENDPAEDPT